VPDHKSTRPGVRQGEVLVVIVESSGNEALIADLAEPRRGFNIFPKLSNALLVEIAEQPSVPDDEFSSVPAREGVLHSQLAKIVLDRGRAEGWENLIRDVVHPAVNSNVLLQQLDKGAFRLVRDHVGVQQAVEVGLSSKD